MKAYIDTFRKYWGLTLQLAKNKISLKYRRSYLGMLWSLLNPLLTMIVLTVVFSTMFKNRIENFPIYLMCGRLIFDFNSEATRNALGSVVGNSSLIKKIYVPKYVFPMSNVIASMVNMLFSFIALILVMIFTHLTPRWTMLFFWVPMVYVTMFSLGLGLILSAINVFFRDIKHLYGVLLTLWTYLTPLFYPVEALSEGLQKGMKFNPLYHYIVMLRGMFLEGTMPTLSENIVCFGMGAFSIAVGLVVFKKTQDKFILNI
ncbi:MAG: ABC transporter permease [Oscillospiraceae bacterium]|nr:ABC transporter permease [Oscillospiraceae bacterium]